MDFGDLPERLIAGLGGAIGAALAGWTRYQDIKQNALKEGKTMTFDGEFFINTIIFPAIFGAAFGIFLKDGWMAFSMGLAGKIGAEAFGDRLSKRG